MVLKQTDREAVLFANDAFYAAFAAGDMAAMRGVWANGAPVSCVHPGWDVLTDEHAVLASWEGILREPPKIRCHAPRVLAYGDTAMVICFEEISGSFLVATNVFVREGQCWRMVHHHAGVTNATPPPADETPPPSIN